MPNSSHPSSNTLANDGNISINRNVFILLLVLVGFLLGGSIGFFLGQYNAIQQFEKVPVIAVAEPSPVQPQAAIVEETSPSEIVPTDIPYRQEISVDDDPYLGPEDAPITIVEFSDYQCSYCARFHEQTLQALMEKYPTEVRFVYRDFPLGGHPEAQKAAEASECADDQGKFWEMQDLLFKNQVLLSVEQYKIFAIELGLDTDTFNTCLDSGKYEDEVVADLMDGINYGISGTPAFFVNGITLMGALPIEQFEAVIEQELNQ
ncbi:MAG: DsbA family protein [Anaerolineaceae bacterium]|nr:DsbA family protein [Anaerolineaceae bacterium]